MKERVCAYGVCRFLQRQEEGVRCPGVIVIHGSEPSGMGTKLESSVNPFNHRAMAPVYFKCYFCLDQRRSLQCYQCLYLNTGKQNWNPGGCDLPMITGNYWYNEILKPKFPDFLPSVSWKMINSLGKKGYLISYLVLCSVPELDSKILKVNFHLSTAGSHTVAD